MDDFVSLEELTSRLLTALSERRTREQVQLIFNLFDRDKKGYTTVKEITSVSKNIASSENRLTFE